MKIYDEVYKIMEEAKRTLDFEKNFGSYPTNEEILVSVEVVIELIDKTYMKLINCGFIRTTNEWSRACDLYFRKLSNMIGVIQGHGFSIPGRTRTIGDLSLDKYM